MSESLTLKKSNCKNCYKCIRHCPVKSIRFSGSQALINTDECILCGRCYVACPQDAREIVDETEKTRVLLQCGSPVYASVAPAFVSYFSGVGIESLRKTLMGLGFAGVEETAIGATIVKNEYDRILNEEKPDVLISSCCHAVNMLIQKYFPGALANLADVITPMQAHCRDIRRRVPDAKVVFIGPCIAKKDESQKTVSADAVLTFDQLEKWLASKNVTLRPEMDSCEMSHTRLFPTTGGILKTMTQSQSDYAFLAVDGMQHCIDALRDIEGGKIHKCFIEMSACSGSCIGGPVMQKKGYSQVSNYLAVSQYAGQRDFEVKQPDILKLKTHFAPIAPGKAMPSESEIASILRQMGKFKPSDELNCGTCGYNTCREKAIAVYQGKAEISMCLPFLKDKAESFSDAIFKNSPNGLILLNDKLEVQKVNQAAQMIMNIRMASDVEGAPAIRIIDTKPFAEVLETGKSINNLRMFLAEYNRYVDMTVIYDRPSHILIGLMRDVTSEQLARDKKDKISQQTVEVADRVVDKQMRIVQEIASLLGETAAETKIALAKLKASIRDE